MPTGMRTTPVAPSSTRRTPYAITVTYQGRGQCSFSINQKASHKQVWSTSMTRSGRMCGLSWERKLKPVQIFSRPGQGSMLKSSSWPTSKTPSPHPSTSPAASLDIKRRSNMHQPLLTSSLGLGFTSPRATAHHPSNVQGYNNEIVIAGSEAAIGHNPGINESEQIGKTTGDKSFEGKIAAPAGTDHKGPPSGKPAADVAEQQGHAADVAEQCNGVKNNTRLVARPRRATKTKRRLS